MKTEHIDYPCLRAFPLWSNVKSISYYEKSEHLEVDFIEDGKLRSYHFSDVPFALWERMAMAGNPDGIMTGVMLSKLGKKRYKGHSYIIENWVPMKIAA